MNPQQDGSSLYHPDNPPANTAPGLAPVSASPLLNNQPPATESQVSWTAAEYIDHPRGAGWYTMLLVGTAVLAAAVYLMTKEYFATGTIVILGIIVAIFAGRKPRQMTYELTQTGLKVGQKLYPYNQYKSFAVMHESGLGSVNLQPMKRFALPISAYFTAQDEPRITGALGQYLPYEERKPDAIDNLSHRLRF